MIERLIGRKLKTMNGVLEIKSATYTGVMTDPRDMSISKIADFTLENGDAFSGAVKDVESCLVPEGRDNG